MQHKQAAYVFNKSLTRIDIGYHGNDAAFLRIWKSSRLDNGNTMDMLKASAEQELTKSIKKSLGTTEILTLG
jgi:hypothetical protein